jgi:RNA polymerase sigma-70 factor, ECF subfamily
MKRHEVRDPSDFDLVRGLADRDASALARLYDRYGGLSYSVALRVLGDSGLAEDTVQECFLKVWNTAAAFDPERGSLRTWLLTLVRNRAIDKLRGRRSRAAREIDLAAIEPMPAARSGSDPWEEVAFATEQQAVSDALARLPAEQRQAVELAYYGGYSHREIAQMTKVPLSTVKGRMRLALEKLHSYLEGKGIMDDR